MNIRIAVLFAAFALAAATPALSFSMLTKDGAWHEKITREALATTLQKDTLGQLAGSRGALGATGAPDIDAPFKDAAHCDNADAFSAAGYPQTAVEARAMLDACRKYAFDRIEDAVRDLAALVTTEGKVVSSQFPSLVSCTFAVSPIMRYTLAESSSGPGAFGACASAASTRARALFVSLRDRSMATRPESASIDVGSRFSSR